MIHTCQMSDEVEEDEVIEDEAIEISLEDFPGY